MPPSETAITTTTSINTDIPISLSPHSISQTKPQPLPQNIRIKNRRKRYLETHPSYFGPSLESADPLLYDRLIRTHQTNAERTSDRAAKGFAGTLEADLLRSEAKLDEVKTRGRSFDPSNDDEGDEDEDDDNDNDDNNQSRRNGKGVTTNGNGAVERSSTDQLSTSTSTPAPTLTPLPIPPDDFTVLTRDEAHQYWVETMTARFVAGNDQDFEYDTIDGDEGLDDVRGEERDREEQWFDGEEEGFVPASESEDGEGKGRELKGETGVQDF